MQKSKIKKTPPQRTAYKQLEREEQKKVEKKFRAATDCSRATFYNKIKGEIKLKPIEQNLLYKLLKIEAEPELVNN